MDYLKSVDEIRQFNRFYTNVLGLLDEYILTSNYSLTEIRILHEMDTQSGCTAKKIATVLNLDAGYLSRTIQKLTRQGLCDKLASPTDKRSFTLELTADGVSLLKELAKEANGQIIELFNDMTDDQQLLWLEGTRSISNAFDLQPNNDASIITIRYDLQRGDIGDMIRLHAEIYGQDCGYNHEFEGYVCKTFYEFMKAYNPDRSRIWFAESDEEIIGTIAIVDHGNGRAQLRWFLLKHEFRGRGIGQNLLEKAITYAKKNNYKNIFLMTSSDQKQAVSMYEKSGFRISKSTKEHLWGKELFMLNYIMNL